MAGDGSTRTLSLTGGGGPSGGAGRSACLFLVLESHRPLSSSLRVVLGGFDEVGVGRGARRGVERAGRRLSVRVDDPWMSTAHARLVRVLGRWALTDVGSKNGSRVNGEVVSQATLSDGDVIEIGRTFFVFRGDVALLGDEAEVLDGGDLRPAAVGFGTLLPALGRVYRDLEAIARSDVSVLVEGETGTGKEVTARAIHGLSGRRGEYVAVNCGAIPAALVEGELFGYKRGAFSDAREDRAGLIRSADRGTLLLDEIGDLPVAAQAALLRVLQEREVRPLGGVQPVRVDVRVIGATHRPMERLVAEGVFRADLFNRLAGHRVTLLPLRERREDLGLLVGAILGGISSGGGITLHPQVVRAFLGYGWPGNVRELEKVLGAAVVLGRGGEVKLEHLPVGLREGGEEGGKEEAGKEEAVSDARREELVGLLREHRGNVSAVARAMGKARMQVQRWLKRYGLDPESFRG